MKPQARALEFMALINLVVTFLAQLLAHKIRNVLIDKRLQIHQFRSRQASNINCQEMLRKTKHKSTFMDSSLF